MDVIELRKTRRILLGSFHQQTLVYLSRGLLRCRCSHDYHASTLINCHRTERLRISFLLIDGMATKLKLGSGNTQLACTNWTNSLQTSSERSDSSRRRPRLAHGCSPDCANGPFARRRAFPEFAICWCLRARPRLHSGHDCGMGNRRVYRIWSEPSWPSHP